MAPCVVGVFSRAQYRNPWGRTRGLFAVQVKHLVEVLLGDVSVKPFCAAGAGESEVAVQDSEGDGALIVGSATLARPGTDAGRR
jgi:hypothetical protein